ncbi:oleate hydratase [Aquincola sp. S2]|uniref:Oleate hydratase n=1 Tax=Pseudaquabacterium terrae TaxID=2732868 RepID=A0ABX2EE37_9BURK|nr:oleate hydratase [Aquabacterium terrae]NRF66880.1 oleate hydratase [Aquabacterium terrae]
MRKVTIVGAGIAGMSAALRLLERGFHVTLLEQDDFMGGMLRACTFPDERNGDRHEHSYHMLMNWYLNLWDIIDELDLRDNWSPSFAFYFLSKGEPNHKMLNVGSPADLLRNVTSGCAPLPDMFLFMYSMIDLLATPMHQDSLLDEQSVNGFMASRKYSTDRAAQLQQKVWETVWAIPSYNASAKGYKNFLKYGNFHPTPQIWIFRKNKYDALIGPIERKLRSYGERFTFMPMAYVHGMDLDEHGRVSALRWSQMDHSPSIDPRGWHKPRVPKEPNRPPLPVDGDLILAVTPGAMTRMVDTPVFVRAPKLGDMHYLNSVPMASVELHFKKGVWLKNVPKDVCVLMDAKYQMTFLDYSQHWPHQHSTFLYVTCSDCEALMSVPPETRIGADEHSPGRVVLDLAHPTTAIEFLLQQLNETMPFDVNEVDLERTRIQTNRGEDLFANETGSEQFRPDTVTNLPNLFLAGTYVRNYADVATIEGAVTSGLMAAEAVRERSGVMPPITVKHAGYHHESVFGALKLLWAPYAYGAKLWSMANDAYGTPNGNLMNQWIGAWASLGNLIDRGRAGATGAPGARSNIPRP